MINGETLRRLRLRNGLRQKEVAKKLGVSVATYAKLEKSVWLQGEQLHAILKALDCTTADVEKILEILN